MTKKTKYTKKHIATISRIIINAESSDDKEMVLLQFILHYKGVFLPFIRSYFFIDSPIKASKFLTQTLGFSTALAQKTIDKARLRINTNSGQIARKGDILQGGVWLTHFVNNYYEPSELIKPIFCTQDFVLFCKPPKILTHPKGNFLHKSLLDSIRFFCGDEAQSVHRLDFETSGAILVARSKKSQITLKNSLMNRKIQKIYLAKVRGEIQKECLINAPIIVPTRPKKMLNTQRENLSIRSKIDDSKNDDCVLDCLHFLDFGNPCLKNDLLESNAKVTNASFWDTFLMDFTLRLSTKNTKNTANTATLTKIAKSATNSKNQKNKKAAKPALTHIVPIYFDGTHTFIKALPLTGRTHQIRLHLAHIGHPIENDFLYGVSDEVSERYLDELKIMREQDRQGLQSTNIFDSKQKTDFGNILYADKILALHSLSMDFVFDGVRYKLSTPKPKWWQES
ncbi:pseudouridine synthase family protein [Helicobacter sp. T3_23-1059]